jgi:3-deoxy-D-manno-octulosonic-acid transferase
MLWLYNIGIFLYGLILRLLTPFNSKAKLFIEGRKALFNTLENQINAGEKHVWFHFASLGEFEQGRPVLEQLKTKHPEKKVVVTFFSPSGYEVRKNYPLADGIFYLPLDTRNNALRFIKAINPELAIFTKYEFWHHYYQILHENNVPLLLISGIFRPSQVFFKSYGGFYRNILKNVSQFFVQNEESARLLAEIGINSVRIAGDTRFDRVYENAEKNAGVPFIKELCGSSPVFIGGSTWPEDEQLIATLANKHKDWKFILAPHEVHAAHLAQMKTLFPESIRYSDLKAAQKQTLLSQTSVNQIDSVTPLLQTQVLIMDNIGLLSNLYTHGDIAYIGGGFGAGIHNTLEAAAFGKPILFGPKYEKFQEAKDLIKLGAAISISDSEGLNAGFLQFQNAIAGSLTTKTAGTLAKEYVQQHQGATEIIGKEIELVFRNNGLGLIP